VSRIETLQTLLTKFGVPGSAKCNQPYDLQPVHHHSSDSLTLQNLHPHLYPIARSSQNPDYFICALKRPSDNNINNNMEAPWPIVESKLNGPGYNLLSLHGEHLMRRIVSHADFLNIHTDVIDLYNGDLGNGKNILLQRDQALDIPYERGSVKKLGYGLDKYILLRVGPFPDLYRILSHQHFIQKGDESSALIAAESANTKFTGFASTFLNYSKLLSIMKQRQEESRDAARLCLRLPLSSIGMEEDDYYQTAVLAHFIPSSKEEPLSHDMKNRILDGTMVTMALDKIKEASESIRENEQEDERTRASMTPTQLAIEEANYLLDQTTWNPNRDWSCIRSRLGDIYASVGMTHMATFVNPSFQ